MKKSIAVLVLIMLVIFAGCSRAETSEDVSSEKPVAEQTTIIESTAEKETAESETTTQKSDNSEITSATTTKTATDKSLEYIAKHDTSGNFLVKECHICGKFTAYVTLD